MLNYQIDRIGKSGTLILYFIIRRATVARRRSTMINNKKSYFVAVTAIMFALIFIAMMLDKTISLALPSGISTATVTLAVTFTLCFLFNDYRFGFLAGVMFGLASWVKALLFGEIPQNNPLVTLLPRIFVGITTFCCYRLILKCFKNNQSKKAQITAMSVSVVVGNMVNTVLFLTALNICKKVMGQEYTGLFAIIKVVIFTNIIPEYLISAIVSPLVVLSVRHGLKLGVDGNNLKRAAKEEGQQKSKFADAESKDDLG